MTSVVLTVVGMTTLLQSLNGSPLNPVGHWQIGWWFWTLHTALGPHAPGQGSIHLSRTQALLLGHSALMEHSGQFNSIQLAGVEV